VQVRIGEFAAQGFPLSSRLLQSRQWDGRLLFAGSETSERGTGHLEGALDAALRVEAQLVRNAPKATTSALLYAVTAKLH
jgi:hypothetical protein